MANTGQDAKFFTRGKIEVCNLQFSLIIGLSSSQFTFQEFRAELQAAETKDKKFLKRKTVLKKIVANITMGNDSASSDLPYWSLTNCVAVSVSPLFTDVVQCLGTPLLEIKKSARLSYDADTFLSWN